MNIIVCIKGTPVSDALIKITPEKPYIDRTNLKYDLNPYDEYAIEAAVQLKESVGGTVTAISVCDNYSSQCLKRALAMGADRLIELHLDYIGLNDPLSIANLLKQEIENQPFDLIITGKQSIDLAFGSVGPLLANLLNIPYIPAVTSLKLEGQKLYATREYDECQILFETALPALITAEKGLNNPRYPSLKDIMLAKKKEVVVKEVTVPQAGFEILELVYPPAREPGKIMNADASSIKELATFIKTLL